MCVCHIFLFCHCVSVSLPLFVWLVLLVYISCPVFYRLSHIVRCVPLHSLACVPVPFAFVSVEIESANLAYRPNFLSAAKTNPIKYRKIALKFK